jgi:hypothetical protein
MCCSYSCLLSLSSEFCRHNPHCYDSVLVHTALLVQQFLAPENMVVLPHPPYSPYLALCDFLFLFPRMKLQLKGCHFQDVSEIQ